jgi:hypothetical protein
MRWPLWVRLKTQRCPFLPCGVDIISKRGGELSQKIAYDGNGGFAAYSILHEMVMFFILWGLRPMPGYDAVIKQDCI